MQQQVPDLSNVDLTHAKDIVCDECGNKGFRQTMMLKKLSALFFSLIHFNFGYCNIF